MDARFTEQSLDVTRVSKVLTNTNYHKEESLDLWLFRKTEHIKPTIYLSSLFALNRDPSGQLHAYDLFVSHSYSASKWQYLLLKITLLQWNFYLMLVSFTLHSELCSHLQLP